MHLDHQSFFEYMEKPAGSLTDLVGVLDSEPVYEDDGLYADAVVFSKWAPMIAEMAPYIGVSIRAAATTEEGEINGELTEIVTELIAGLSVDFVTKPGANGRIVEILENKPEVLPAGTKLVTSHPATEAGTGKKKGKPVAELTEETGKEILTVLATLTGAVSGLTTTIEAAKPAEVEKKEEPKVDVFEAVKSATDALIESGLSGKSRDRVLATVKAGTPIAEAIEAEKEFVAEVLAEAGGTPLHVVGQGKAEGDKKTPFGLREGDDKILSSFLTGKVAG
jgi:hypothetical protein